MGKGKDKGKDKGKQKGKAKGVAPPPWRSKPKAEAKPKAPPPWRSKPKAAEKPKPPAPTHPKWNKAAAADPYPTVPEILAKAQKTDPQPKFAKAVPYDESKHPPWKSRTAAEKAVIEVARGARISTEPGAYPPADLKPAAAKEAARAEFRRVLERQNHPVFKQNLPKPPRLAGPPPRRSGEPTGAQAHRQQAPEPEGPPPLPPPAPGYPPHPEVSGADLDDLQTRFELIGQEAADAADASTQDDQSEPETQLDPDRLTEPGARLLFTPTVPPEEWIGPQDFGPASSADLPPPTAPPFTPVKRSRSPSSEAAPLRLKDRRQAVLDRAGALHQITTIAERIRETEGEFHYPGDEPILERIEEAEEEAQQVPPEPEQVVLDDDYELPSGDEAESIATDFVDIEPTDQEIQEALDQLHGAEAFVPPPDAVEPSADVDGGVAEPASVLIPDYQVPPRHPQAKDTPPVPGRSSKRKGKEGRSQESDLRRAARRLHVAYQARTRTCSCPPWLDHLPDCEVQIQEELDYHELSDRVAATLQLQQYQEDVAEAEAAEADPGQEPASSSAGPAAEEWILDPTSGRRVRNPTFGLRKAKVEVKEEAPATPEPIDTLIDLEVENADVENVPTASASDWTSTNDSSVPAPVPTLPPVPEAEALPAPAAEELLALEDAEEPPAPPAEPKAPPPTGVPRPKLLRVPTAPPKLPPAGILLPVIGSDVVPPPPPQLSEAELALIPEVVVPPPPPRARGTPDPPSRQ